jgi:hypothetical protein
MLWSVLDMFGRHLWTCDACCDFHWMSLEDAPEDVMDVVVCVRLQGSCRNMSFLSESILYWESEKWEDFFKM